MHKIVFMGSDAIALPLLDWLHAHSASHGAALVAVYSQPDRPKGRGKKLSPNPVSAWALDKGIALFRPEKPTSEDAAWLREQGIDLALVMAYGHILRKSLLAVPPRGFVNFHASLLPKFRGASPVESSVATGEAETGVTLMEITPPMDEGPACDVERVAIEPSDTGGSMREKLAAACPALIARNLTALLDGSATFIEQDHASATYCRKLVKADGALDFLASAKTLVARINGLDPWPGCFADHGETRLKLRGAAWE
ncbi:MAG: methionyl-tRNA formyltransferase, partial [Puniceicoccales bacterium]